MAIKKEHYSLEVEYVVYYGGEAATDKNCKRFKSEDAANTFFNIKQALNMHVEVYREETKTVKTITRLV